MQGCTQEALTKHVDVERGLCAVLIAFISDDCHDWRSGVADALMSAQGQGMSVTLMPSTGRADASCSRNIASADEPK
jgi:hypothetical protein